MNEMESKNNEKNEENNKEEKKVDALKNNINNEDISDINIKNQSIHNNNENEEIKLLIENNNEIKKEEEIIKKVNNIPKIESYSEYKFNNTIKKIKNKSIEKKMKDIFNSDKKNNKNENAKDNKFIDKLNKIEIKIKEINDYNKKKKNKKEFNIKNYEDENYRYKSIDKENEKNVKEEFNKKNPFYFDYNIKNKKEDRKNKKDFKQTYFSYDNFYFYNIPSENRKKSKYMNYTQDLKKIFKKYNDQRLLRKNNNFNSFNKILFKVDKFKQSQEENKFKSNNLFKNSIDLGDTTKYRNISNIINYKSLSLEKPSKLERIIENIYSDINKTSDNPSKNNFERKLLDMKSKIKNSNIICNRNNIETMNANHYFNKNRFTKSNFSEIDNLIKSYSNNNFKKYFYNTSKK